MAEEKMNAAIRRIICMIVVGMWGAAGQWLPAQVDTGFPPYVTFSGGPFDSVNNANLNVHFAVPIVQRAGRGLPLSYALSYDSSIWTPKTSGSTTAWTPQVNWGWTGVGQSAVGYTSYNTTQKKCPDNTPYNNYDTWVYYDAAGTGHPFAITISDPTSHCSTTTSATELATDASGYTINATASGGGAFQMWIYSRSGATIEAPLLYPDVGGALFDSNGNMISTAYGSPSTITDTLGNVVTVTKRPTQPTDPTTQVYTYTGPSGAQETVQVNYTAYSVQTNFGCTGIGINEYYNASVYLISSVVYPGAPDPTSYQFTYEQTPGNPNAVTGRIQTVIRPTGGSITYTYDPHLVSCTTNRIIKSLDRNVSDGVTSNTWHYKKDPGGNITTITDPLNYDTVITSYRENVQRPFFEHERDFYNGLTGSAILKKVVTCYKAPGGSCSNFLSSGVPVNQTIQTTTVLNPSNQSDSVQASVTFTFDVENAVTSYGLPEEIDETDFGTSGPGAVIRKRVIHYTPIGQIPGTAYTLIMDRPDQVKVEDGSGTVISQTNYAYDETALQPTSGTPQLYGGLPTTRGNPTTVSSAVVPVSSWLTRKYTYYDTGMVYQATDVNNAQTTYNYGTGSCGNSFPTSVTMPASLSRSMAWDCAGGVQTSATDENGRITSYNHTSDPLWRVNSIQDATGATTNMYYYTNNTGVESSLEFNSGASRADVRQTLDGLGRVHISQRKQQPNVNSYDSTETDYDALGRPSKVTAVPYSAAAATPAPVGTPGVTTTYDALGRPLLTTDAGGGTLTYSYFKNDVMQTAGPAASGENAKSKQLEYDALGRLASVCEITSDPVWAGTCGQTSPVTGYWTKYTYDVLNNLTGVSQDYQHSGGVQYRTYTYDGLGRLTRATTPEEGPPNYTYDTDATCGTSNGDLVKKVDAMGNRICYGYDALHRVTSITYSPTSTPNKYFVYDSATVNGVVMANAKGRLAEAYTATCSTCSKLTDVGFSYSARGEVTDTYQSTPHSGGYYHASATYWENGLGKTLNLFNTSGTAMLPTFTVGPEAEGRASSLSASSGINPVSSTAYNTAGQVTSMIFPTGDVDAYGYDHSTGRMKQFEAEVNGMNLLGTLTWNANGTLSTLQMQDPWYPQLNQTCSYVHDDLARLKSVDCKNSSQVSIWTQTFTYDPFGNIQKTGSNGGTSFLPTYATPSSNRMSTLGGQTVGYNSNGGLINDTYHTYNWDAENRPTTVGSMSITYDALGRWVEESSGGTYTQNIYAPGGAALALIQSQALAEARIGLPDGGKAIYKASGLAKFWHPDWLGTTRLISSPTRTILGDASTAPFGESYNAAPGIGGDEPSFTGKYADHAGDLFDFPAREFHPTQGRWLSPDPVGGDPANPQSLNRYGYVLNNPTMLTDPTGLCADFDFNFTYLDPNTGRPMVDSNGIPLTGVHVDSGPCPPPPLPPSYIGNLLCSMMGTCGYDNGGILVGGGGTGGGDTGSSTPPAVDSSKPANNALRPCSASTSSTSIWSGNATTNIATVAAGAAIGGAIGGPVGAALGATIGSFFGVGGTASYVPSTKSLYAGLTVVFAPAPGGGNGFSGNVVSVPGGQNPNSIANGLSYSVTFQPSPLLGSTVVKSPGSGPPVVGPSVGTRIPVSVGVSYNFPIRKGGC
jgi:RHS repeat-associated protein